VSLELLVFLALMAITIGFFRDVPRHGDCLSADAFGHQHHAAASGSGTAQPVRTYSPTPGHSLDRELGEAYERPIGRARVARVVVHDAERVSEIAFALVEQEQGVRDGRAVRREQPPNWARLPGVIPSGVIRETGAAKRLSAADVGVADPTKWTSIRIAHLLSQAFRF
jgi:hypothetical protein